MATTLWRGIAVIGLLLLASLLLLLLSRLPKAEATTFLGHVEDLRRRLIVSAAAVFTIMAFLFSFDWAPGALYPVPALQENLAARLFLRVAEDSVPSTVQLVVARPMDGFAAEMTIALGLALVLASPVVTWQMGGFLWPALKPKEQRILLQAFLPVVALFLAGAAFAYFVVLPFLLDTLYAYGTALGAQGLLPVSEFISFVLGMIIVFGVAFQLPLVMWALTRIGVVSHAFWKGHWRHAIVVIFVLSAVVTDPTLVSQVLVAIPLTLLYFGGIALSYSATRASAATRP